MSLLQSTSRVTAKAIAASATNHTCVMQIVAPANQKLKVKFTVYGKGTTATDTPMRFTVRRGVSNSGATTASITLAKVNGQDAETLQATALSYSVDPTNVSETNNGTVIYSFVVYPVSGEGTTPVFQVNGGETLTIWGITATNAGVADVIGQIEE